MMRRRLSSLAQSQSAKSSWKSSSSGTGYRSPGYSLHRYFSAPSSQNDDFGDSAKFFAELSQDSNDSDSFPFSVDQGFTDSVPIPVSPDIVTVTTALPDSIEVATAVTNVLGHSPPHLVIRLLENVHLLADIPYWETIVVTTVAFRLILFPIAVYTVKSASRMAHARPKIQKLQTEFQDHPNNMDPALQTEFRRKMSQLLEREKVNPVRSLIFPIIQIPMFVSFFFGLKEIGQFLPGAITGGTMWFTDLTATDPYFIFPVLNALSFLIIIEIGVDGLPSNPDLDRFKWFLRMFAFGLIPLTATMPQSVFVYWATNNTISISQTLLLKNKDVKKFLGILDPPPPDPNAPPPMLNPFSAIVQMVEKQEQQIRDQKKKARDAAMHAASSSSTSSSPLQQITIIPNTSNVTVASSDPLQTLSAQSKPSESLEVETRAKDSVNIRK